MQLIPMSGAADKFDVYLGDRAVGMVWKMQGLWAADQANMASPRIFAETKEAAAQKLIEGL